MSRTAIALYVARERVASALDCWHGVAATYDAYRGVVRHPIARTVVECAVDARRAVTVLLGRELRTMR